MAAADAVTVVLDLIAEAAYTENTVRTFENVLGQFGQFAAASGIDEIGEISPALALEFIEAPVPAGGTPALETMRLRRASLRLLFRVLRTYVNGLVDPTADIYLPLDQTTETDRPLTNTELDALRSSAAAGRYRTSHAAVLALALAGAAGDEIADLHVTDIRLTDGVFTAPGTRRSYQRVLRLDDWGIDAVAAHLDVVADHASGLVLTPRKDNSTRRSSRAAVQYVIQGALNVIGLWGTANIGGRTIQHTGARLAFDASQRIEDAAHLLGVRSLDRAAEAIGHDWLAERGDP